MNTRITWLMLTCTLLCVSCAKTRGVSLGSTSEVDDVDAGPDDGGGEDDDDELHDERHRDGEDEEDEEDERAFWLKPF